MSFSSPSPPDPTQTSNTQSTYNTAAAKTQQGMNMYNQTNPYGSLTYNNDPNSPNGYSINTQLSPAEQQLLQTQQGTQQTLGNTAQNLANNTASMYSQPPSLDPSAMTNKMMGWYNQYMDPINKQKQSQLDAQLVAQGIGGQGSSNAAYNNAQNLQARNVNDAQNSFFMQAEPLAFNQAVQQYQLPQQELSTLLGQSSPQGGSFQQGPQVQVQPPNYAGQVQQDYTNQVNQQNAMNNGLFGIGSAVGGGWAKAGFPGLSSLFAAA